MLEIVIAIILVVFFGLFFVMAVPLKEQADKLNQQEPTTKSSD